MHGLCVRSKITSSCPYQFNKYALSELHVQCTYIVSHMNCIMVG